MERPVRGPSSGAGGGRRLLYEGYVLYPYRASSREEHRPAGSSASHAAGYVAADPSERRGARPRWCSRRTWRHPPRADAVLAASASHRRRPAGLGRGGRPAGRGRGASRRAAGKPAGSTVRGRCRASTDRPASNGSRGNCRGTVDCRDGSARTIRRAAADGSVENRTAGRSAGRDEALRGALVAAHTLCALTGADSCR